MFWSLFASILFLASPCKGFFPNLWSKVLILSWDSYTHQYITEQAICNVTLEVLRDTTKQDERVDSSIAMLRQIWTQIVLSIRAKEYESARNSLGQLFHSLQPINFSRTYLSLKGKCSHGGPLDNSRHLSAKGGINKDTTSPMFSPHHYLHEEAAALAAKATLMALRELKDTVGAKAFLKLFSVRQAPALVFVIDTTGSMFEEITGARLRAHSIIQRRANSAEQPGTFLLVPFHDPGDPFLFFTVFGTPKKKMEMKHFCTLYFYKLHYFIVDSSVKNVILHITGTMTECILTSPSGIICTLSKMFHLMLGAPAFLVLAVTGQVTAQEGSFHVTLLGAEGESLQQVKLNHSSSSPSHGSEELVGFVDYVPMVPFSVRLTGLDSRGNTLERVSTEKIQPTRMVLTPHLVPGHRTVVDFDIFNHGPARLFNLTADDDCGYLLMRGPLGLFVEEQGSFRGQVSLLTPATAHTGATVTLTLTVNALDSLESNYAVTFLTVVPLMQKGDGILTIFHNPPPTEENFGETLPNFEHQHLHKNKTTSRDHWHHHHYRARLQTGDPPLNVSEWALGSSQPLWVMYMSSCCSAQAEILVWDKAGNMKRCILTSGQHRVPSDVTTETSGTCRASLKGVILVLVGLLWSTLT
ncbi:hypothetical protein GOODEAATRI_005490 [Goodea atripinnis]|uniref:von Willebrand factor A domain containing 7 n=1 Tax=Goodea atripinnis TaxID=208336 RepID=A0ABV0N8D8_9TELE